MTLACVILLFSGCMKDEQWIEDRVHKTQLTEGVFIVNEGNFMYGNATLSFYDPSTKKTQNNIFKLVNGIPLGDVGQSMIIYNNEAYIVMNNSGKVYVIDADNCNYTGKITGLTSPRYVYIINDQKGYITDLYAGRITVFNPETKKITGSIITGNHKSTEQMVRLGDKIFITCWSFDNTILIIDANNDAILGEIKTNKQPGGIVTDNQNKLWVLCDGGWGKPGAVPTLQKINPETGVIELTLNLPSDANAKRLTINQTRDSLLFISGGIWRMPVNSGKLPDSPFIRNHYLLYGLGIDPGNSEIYFSDAIDYSQKGIVYRYSAAGAPIDSFKTGIIPSAFCFKK